jgi:hypothetical protein
VSRYWLKFESRCDGSHWSPFATNITLRIREESVGGPIGWRKLGDHVPYPTQSELILHGRDSRWLDVHFLRPDPFAFRSTDFRQFAALIGSELDVESNGVYCVGSGAVGLSLNPKNVKRRHLSKFDADSDLDIAIVSSRHFEQGWRDLRLATSPALDEVDNGLRRVLTWQKTRLFDGAIIADRVLSKLSFGGEWLEALNRLQNQAIKETDEDRDMHIWIYRDYWSLRHSIMRSVKACLGKVDS